MPGVLPCGVACLVFHLGCRLFHLDVLGASLHLGGHHLALQQQKNTATTRQKHGPFCFALVCWETLRVFCGMLSRDFYCLLLFSCFMISTLYRIIHNLGSSLSPILAQACAPRLNFLARSTA